MIHRPTRRLLLGAVLIVTATLTNLVHGQGDRSITVASTTSTEASGLFGHILPIFERKTGIDVHVVAVGTGQALDIGRRGDADVVFVHDPAGEERFVAEGHGVGRHEIMYNDYVIVGPESDPAGVEGMADAAAALAKIAAAGAPFASRGDDSGTHRKELALWQAAGVEPSGDWYRETGSGMGQTLNTAAGMDAYALTDRGTWIGFGNRQDLEVMVEGDPRLFNQYGVVLVSPDEHPHVESEAGQRFIDWLLSEEGQRAIAGYQVNGRQLFFPNADAAGS